jgi:GDP-L-fucose synthase
MMEKDAKIYIAGHSGLVGSAILRALQRQGYHRFVLRTHMELDLRDPRETLAFFEAEQPDYVFMAAATVGGVVANDTHPAKFFYDNITMGVNVIDAAHRSGVKKLLYMGSSCIYPRDAAQPMTEDALLRGRAEPTNEAYAMAKISCLKMCEYYAREYGCDFISCMPCNAYGPGDDFDPATSHVVAALMRRFHEAKEQGLPEVVIWGSGTPIREFIFIDDIADAAVFLMQNYAGHETVNVGTGTEYSIRKLAEIIRRVVGYEGKIVNDLSKPDGSPRKLLDSGKIFRMGWRPKVSFEDGMKKTYQDFLENIGRYLGKEAGSN